MYFTRCKILTKSMELEMQVKGTGSSWVLVESRCVLLEYVKDNYNVRYHNPSYHKYRKTHFSILLYIKFWQSQWNVTCRSRVRGQGACLPSKSWTITMQGIIILATISTEKHTLVFYSMWRRKILTKSIGAWNVGQGYHKYRETHFRIYFT